MGKKLIEVALPLEAINAASAREKSIRHGHPSALHLWWARRPLATARAVIWASLVDDPSSHPEQFPTPEAQNKERDRLFDILRRLVIWENSNDPQVLAEAKAEIMKSTNNNPPALLDPFAGGGAIPLEAQRLGLKAYAHDLNPVAVMINKAMIEIPPRFANMRPVNPRDHKKEVDDTDWTGARGLAADVQYYGEWMKNEAYKRIGHLYPKIHIPGEKANVDSNVIAWIWARTVKCPNPACGCEMPLASSFVLSKKKGNEAWIDPQIDYKNNRISYIVHRGRCPKEKETIKLAKGASFKCVKCGSVVDKNYIHNEFINKRVGQTLIAIVAENSNGSGRVYLSPSTEHEEIADLAHPEWWPEQEMDSNNPNLVSGRGYGIRKWGDLFTKRQLVTLTLLTDLVKKAENKVEQDAISAGMKNDNVALRDGGTGAKAYGEAVSVYLSFLVDQIANHSSVICGWNSTNAQMRNTFARQAIPMTWDYAECNIFSHSSGSYDNLHQRMCQAFELLGNNLDGEATQYDAQQDCGLRNIMVSTDPPYYDNIDYSDLSDFFYIWMRKSLRTIYPSIFGTMLVPKTEELIATPFRHNGNMEEAKGFFEDGMLSTCKQIYKYNRDDIPVTIYYAYKQSDSDDSGTASSGWETMLSAIIKAGFSITGTWPMRTEKPGRTIENGTNALASSIVLVCRKRNLDAPLCTKREFVIQLKKEFKTALAKLKHSNIAPVDLAQSAIGPGIGVFSRYSKVIESDGSPMSIRSALAIINEEIDAYFNEEESDLDSQSRFCVDLYTQFAFNDIPYGDADTLARAKNISVGELANLGIINSEKGRVNLLTRDEIPNYKHEQKSVRWLAAQQLTKAMDEGGIEAAAKIVADLDDMRAEHAKDLVYRLYTIADKKNRAQEALEYNNLIVAWPDVQVRAAQIRESMCKQEQLSLFE
jgi:putative DNA methylase